MKKEKEKIDWRIISTALICLTALELYALSQGYDGLLLLSVFGIIAATIGVVIPNPIRIK